jgi:fluoride exporter
MGRELYLTLLVFLGAGVGGVLRHGVSLQFPLSTLLVNIAGCFAMGVLTGWFAFRGEAASQHLRLLLTTGVLGGFTTFSAFSLDTALLWERGAYGAASFYVASSVACSLVGVFAGLALMRALLH